MHAAYPNLHLLTKIKHKDITMKDLFIKENIKLSSSTYEASSKNIRQNITITIISDLVLILSKL